MDATPLFTFESLETLEEAPNLSFALQVGYVGGIWIRATGSREGNGGTVVAGQGDFHWRRQCDPSRLDARWFGVRADGTHDDSAALQRVIDALPEAGGCVLLPAGKMRCTRSLEIRRSYISIEGSNSGLRSRHFEPGGIIGEGSLLFFEGGDGIIIQPPEEVFAGQTGRPARLGGITLRNFGIAGTGKSDGQTGVRVQAFADGKWGSTDGLMLERIYTIDLTWGAELSTADMTVITGCWLSECGNGLRLEDCVYNLMTNICFADNDSRGLVIEGGKGHEVTSSVFVRNQVGLEVKQAQHTRVTGGIFECDLAVKDRRDEALIRIEAAEGFIASGVSFSSQGQGIEAAVAYRGHPPEISGSVIQGELQSLTRRLDQ